MRYIIEYFIRCKKFIGRKIYYLLALMMIAGFMEGISVTLFLPILQTGFGDEKLSKILKVTFDFFRIKFSFNLFLFLIMAFFILRLILLISYARYAGKIMSNLMITLRNKILHYVFAADYIYILKKEIGYINNAIVREIAGVIDAFRTFSLVLKYVILAFVYMALSLILNFKMSIVVLAFCPTIIFLTLRLNAWVARASRDYSFLHGKFHSLLFQALGKFKYLKATLSNRKLSELIDKENKNLGNIRFKLFFFQSFSKDTFETLIVFLVLGVLFYYVSMLGKGVSEIIFLIFLFLQAARQFLSAQNAYRKFLSSRGSIETFNKFEKELDDHKEDLNLQGVRANFNENIVIRDVTLIFPNGKKALDKINVNIKSKSVVAFVGQSGSGKSTVANVITGILRPTEGEILLGNVSYRNLNLKTLRENIGYITQEDVIFNASIRDNIALWGENVDENNLANVIQMSQIKEFIDNLPEKIGSVVGDSGLDISGGQRQRITIARELYKDTKLLILDEATSSLDSKLEKRIYENLKEFRGKKTIVVIAHRLSTVKNADYVYVLDRGRVIEEGPYDELYARKGEFKRMIEEQKLV